MLQVTAPSTNRAERAHVLDVVLGRWLGLTYSFGAESDQARSPVPGAGLGATVFRLDGQPGSVRVVDGVLSTDVDELISLPAVDDDVVVDSGVGEGFPLVESRLPVLYGPTPDRAIACTDPATTNELGPGRDLTVGLDVFGTVFTLLTGLEDRFLSERDEHGRVPMAPTLIARRGVQTEPVVDQVVELLWAALATVWPRLQRRSRTSSIRVTQDVDRLSKFGDRTVGHLALATASGVRRAGLAEGVTVARQAIQIKRHGLDSDPYYSFDRFMGLAERHGHKASFFFIARYRESDGTALSRYRMNDPGATDLIRRATERGHEIGLHPGYDSFRNQAEIEGDADALRVALSAAGATAEMIGGRHHYLRWDTMHSPACWHGAGLAHDSSLGWAEGVGFRVGTSKTFPLWDPIGRTQTEVEERPLVWMDVALLHLGLSYSSDEAAERVLRLRERCLRYGGDYTILMHNDEFAALGAEQLLDLALQG